MKFYRRHPRRSERGHYSPTGLFAVVAFLFFVVLTIFGLASGRTAFFALGLIHLPLTALFGFLHKKA